VKLLKTTKWIISAMVLLCAGCETKKIEAEVDPSIKAAYFEWVDESEKAHGKVEAVISLYTDDAILLPTLCPKIYTNNNMRVHYFQRFLSLKDLKIQTRELITREYGDIAMNTGLYDISYMKDGERVLLRSRFDFWYKKIDGKWMIIYHQSSALPKEGRLDGCLSLDV
jgi:hypothetical protein